MTSAANRSLSAICTGFQQTSKHEPDHLTDPSSFLEVTQDTALPIKGLPGNGFTKPSPTY